jgi:hypothetical protein
MSALRLRSLDRLFLLLFALVLLAGQRSAAANGFDVYDMQVQNDRDVPEVCFFFDYDLPTAREATLEDYVAVAPPFQASVTARGNSLCIAGFGFGKRYQVTLLSGLPAGEGGYTLDGERYYDIYMPDRPASIGFRGGNGYILPSTLADGLPLRSVNVDHADLRLIRINDRNLVQQLARGKLNQTLWDYDVSQLADLDGEVVWEGTLEIPNPPRNEAVDSIVPVREILGTLEPGIYVAAARDPDAENYWEPVASQWFVISDIGLTTFWGDNGLWVYARTLSGAQPIAGMELALLAQNNSELGRAATDAGGFVRFDGGLLRGSGGNLPRAVLAYGNGGDFNLLDLGGPVLDLVDRGIGGRSLPGALDAFLYTERGIYRPGETVHLTGVLRDRAANAVADVPLTVTLWRSDGAEYRSYSVADQGAGSYSLDIDLPGSARTGLWEATIHADPKGPAIGRVAFEVEDFVPPQIEFDLASEQSLVTLEAPIVVNVAADYLYGAPAGDLPGEYTLLLQRAESPFPTLPGYQFGLAQESFTPLRTEPVGFTTDAEGHAVIEAWADQTPDTSHPLEASVRVAVFDLGGRPIYRRITVPVALQLYHIGISPLFQNGAVGEGGTASFDVIAVDRSGTEVAVDQVSYAVLSEEYDYVWYRSGGQWYAEWVVREHVVETGDVALSAGEPGRIEFKPSWGLYRVEVFDDETGVASSVRFSGGWWTDPTADRPDEVEVSLDKESYVPGETARVFIKPPFAARVLVTVADSDLRWSTSLEVPAAGGFVDIPVSDQWTAGTYVLASAYPTDPASKEMLPRRAVGVDWLALDQAYRTLAMTMTLPEKIRPSQRLEVPLSIAGAAAGEAVYLTLAAVDDAVLQLTGYTAPDPIDYFLGKRALDVLLHDVYGYLIRSEGDVVAGLRSGGDLEGRNLESLPERSSKVVSLYSGIVEVGTDGQATVGFEVPDFNGRLRVMGVAWSKTRIGSAEGTIVVRAPLIAEMTLPRFLAPGDAAQVTVALRNLDGSAGDYKITIATDGVVSVDNAVIEAKGLAVGKEARETRTLTAETLGVATITLSVSGPQGYSLVREKRISVRPASPRISERLVASLPAGKSVTLTTDLVADYYLPSAWASLTLSTVPDFDVPGLLAELNRYPYGCAEQTVSTAMPLLYVNDVAIALGLEDDATLSARVQEAIYRLMNMQLGYGAFGLWGPWSDGEFWLTAYVTDFLTRASEQGYHVPAAGYSKALDYLEGQTNGYLDSSAAVAGYAYAQYVLARAGMGDLSELRYFYETRWHDLPTPLSRAQFSAALAWLGDLERARTGFGDLLPTVYDAGYRAIGDYGSDLRDRAAAVALMAEGGAIDDRTIVRVADVLARDFAARRWFSTQEMSWLLLATHALSERSGEIKLTVDGTPYGPSKEPFYARVAFSQGEGPLSVANNSKGPLYEVVTIDGVPIEPLPPEENGFTVRRRIFDLSGRPVALAKVQQGENYLVLIEGRSHDGLDHDALVVDLLPAGFEIENANLGQGVPLDAFPWLGELSWTQATEARDDRFAAALKLNYSRQGFRVAYMVRAVTPGNFVLPAVFVEDMYRPELNARGAPSKLVISAR